MNGHHRLARFNSVPHFLVNHHAHRRVNGVSFLLAPPSQQDDGQAHLTGHNLGHISASRGRQRLDQASAGQPFLRVLDRFDFPPLPGDHLLELRPRGTRAKLLTGQVRGRLKGGGLVPQVEHVGGNGQAVLCEVRWPFTVQRLDGLFYLQRVAHCPPERLVHVTEQRRDLPPVVSANVHHEFGQRAGLFQRAHKSAVAHFYVEHNGIGTASQLLGHDAAGNQGQALDRGGGIPQGVKLAVGWHQFGRLGRHHQADFGHLTHEFLASQFDSEAGNALQLVKRSACEAQPPAAHLGHGQAGTRHQRPHHEGRFVPHAAGGVLVHHARRHVVQVEHLPAAGHDVGEHGRLFRRHAAEEDRHAPGRGLIVGYLAAHVALHEPANLLFCEDVAVPFLGNNVYGAHQPPLSAF